MPHSHPHGKMWAADMYAVLRPRRVVEIGPGAGMWSDALRPRWRGHWIGIEIWEPYLDTYGLRDKYDRLMVADFREVDFTDLKPDLIIAGDVLEHVPRSDAELFIQNVIGTLPYTNLLVSVPIVHYDQGPLEGNPNEAHLWHPTHNDMMELLQPMAWTCGDIVGAYWRGPSY